MFVDTSAAVAILAREPDAERYAVAIARAAHILVAPHVRLEACMVLSRMLDLPVDRVATDYDRFLADAGAVVVPITDEVGRAAVEAFTRYGKGRGSKAQLDLADCLSYAVAATHRVPILFKGDDFAQTDLPSALAS